MSRYRSVGLVLAAVAILAVAFVALRPSDDQEAPTPAPSDGPVTREPADTSPSATAERADPEPVAVLLAPGSPQEIRVDRGEMVRFRARSPQDDEIHVHGYDLTKEAAAGETVSVSFPADIEGIFEIELERSGRALGELRVDP